VLFIGCIRPADVISRLEPTAIVEAIEHQTSLL
jgi:hypothetical protein